VPPGAQGPNDEAPTSNLPGEVDQSLSISGFLKRLIAALALGAAAVFEFCEAYPSLCAPGHR
jgi:hypothetical protein